jgi:hypothetical protein
VAAYAVVEQVFAVPRPHRRIDWRVDATSPRAAVELPTREAVAIEDEADTLADRGARIREAIGQATWYLFNAEGWR